MASVLDALNRINRSLDERFEKNADLYLAPEQTEKLKHLIYLGNYPQIVKEFTLKKYSAEALANVLIKNAWLMWKSNYKLLDPIFEACDYRYLRGVMQEGVFDNKIEIPSEFRLQLIVLFLDKGESTMCRQMLGQKLLFMNHPRLKAICVRQAFKDAPILERYRLFNDYAAKNMNILTEAATLKELFPAEEFTDKLRSQIFEEHLKEYSPLWNFWVNLMTAADIPFFMEQFKKYCRLNSSNLPACKNLFARLNPIAKNDFETFAEKFAEACACMDGFKKEKLARRLLNIIKDKQEDIFRVALNRHGIEGGDKGKLADEEEITERLCTDNDFLYNKEVFWLVASFDKKYSDDCENVLNRIRGEVSDRNRFKNFCLTLVKSKFWQLRYLVYVIEELVPAAADKNDPFVKELLTHIHDKDLLRKNRFDPNIKKVLDFVKMKDFDLFTRLKQF